MTALTYTELAGLCDQRLGTRGTWRVHAVGPNGIHPQIANVERCEFGIVSSALRHTTVRDAASAAMHTKVSAEATGNPKQSDAYAGKQSGADQDYAALQLEKAQWLWQHRQPVAGSPAETYLREVRAYAGPLPATLGFLPPQKKSPHPAMVAAFGIPDEPEPGELVIAEHQVRGVHLTLLALDGGKAEVKRNKLFVGSSSGWPIVIAPPNDLLGMVVTEGIEDALSARQATGLGAWAATPPDECPLLPNASPHTSTASLCAPTMMQPDNTALTH